MEKLEPIVINIEKESLVNQYYRREIFTGNFQIFLMSLKVNEEIGFEVHKVDQFFRIEKGNGILQIIDPNNINYMLEYDVSESNDNAMIIPAGTQHNVKNTGNIELKCYTIYSSPVHINNLIQVIKPSE